MAENYYPEPSKYNPNIVEAHVATIIDYVASVIFPYEYIVDKQKAWNRILLSDAGSGSNVALGDAYQFFKSMNDFFPFAVYNVGNSTLFEEYGNVKTLNSGFIYNEQLECYIYSYPAEFEMQFVVFFNDALDHRKAYAKSMLDQSAYTQIISPILINETEFQLPLRLNIQLDKGDLASELEQYLIQNRIWNYNFTITALYSEFVLEEPNFLGSTVARYLSPRNIDRSKSSQIDSIETSYNNNLNNSQGTLISSVVSPDTLKVLSVSPIDGTEGFSRTGIIEINFNKPIRPDSVKSGILIYPVVDLEYFYNVDYTTVNIQAWNPTGFPSNGYKVTVNLELKDIDDLAMENPYVFDFTTN
jgi:hypothetical protein